MPLKPGRKPIKLFLYNQVQLLMKQIDAYITEKLHLKAGMDSNIEEKFYGLKIEADVLSGLCSSTNKKAISRFLKGTNGYNSLKICLDDIYIHVFRYSDMHKLEITALASTRIKWPNEEEWKEGVVWNADDRMKMNDLFDDFYDFIETKVLNKIDYWK